MTTDNLTLGIRWHNPKAIARQLEPYAWMNVECVVRREPRAKKIIFVITTPQQTNRYQFSTFEGADWTVSQTAQSPALNLVPRKAAASAPVTPPSSSIKALQEWSLTVPFAAALDLFKKAGDRHLLWQGLNPADSFLVAVLCNANGQPATADTPQQPQPQPQVLSISFTNFSNGTITGAGGGGGGGGGKTEGKTEKASSHPDRDRLSLDIRNPALLQTMISRLALMDPYFQTRCVKTTKSTKGKASNKSPEKPGHHRPRHFLLLQTSAGIAQGRYIVPVGSGGGPRKKGAPS